MVAYHIYKGGLLIQSRMSQSLQFPHQGFVLFPDLPEHFQYTTSVLAVYRTAIRPDLLFQGLGQTVGLFLGVMKVLLYTSTHPITYMFSYIIYSITGGGGHSTGLPPATISILPTIRVTKHPVPFRPVNSTVTHKLVYS